MGLGSFKLRNRFIKAYDEGWLSPCDGHEIHYYQVGNPSGEVVIHFHGGPGGRAKPSRACIYNLKKQRIIMFDQRACGQSRYQEAFYKNTPQDTVKDANRLLNALKIKGKVVSAGASFGSTLAVLFAQTYPQKIKRLCVDSVFLGRQQDLENMTPASDLFYPDAVAQVKKQVKGKNLDKSYAQLIFSKKQSDNEKALRYFAHLERMAGGGALKVDFPKTSFTEKDVHRFRVFMHYVKNNMFLKPNQLIKEATKIKHIPAEIFQNRLDFCCPPYQAWELHQALPKSKLTLVADKGHGSNLMRYLIYLGNKARKY